MRSQFDNRKLDFDWDEGNQTKNWKKHNISRSEAEEIFFNIPLVVKRDIKHSQDEERFHALGKTNDDKHLFIAFTMRSLKIRIISARSMDRREQHYYKSIKSQPRREQ